MKTNITKILKTPYFYICAVAVLFALAIRFFNIQNRIIFDWDQENYANQIYDLIVNHQPTLLGPRTTSDTGFYLAPYFTYIMAPFYMLAGMHPVGGLYFIILYNLIFFPFAAYLISKIFNLKTAAVFILFWAINFMMIDLDIIPWWPVIVPLGILVQFFLIKKTTEKNEWKWWILLGINSGLFMNMHFQFVFIMIFTGIFYIVHFWKAKNIPWLQFVASIATFAFMYTPLVLFDVRHNFLNVGLFVNFFFGDGNVASVKNPFAWIPVLTNFMEPYTGLRVDWFTLCVYAIIFGVMSFLVWKTKKGFLREFFIASAAIWFLVPIFFIYYNHRPSEYYFIFLLPFMLISVIYLFVTYLDARVLLFFAAVVLFVSADNIQSKIISQPFTLATKDTTARYIKEHYNTKTFTVSFDVTVGREPGFRYLMRHYGIQLHNDENANLPLIEVQIPLQENSVKITDDIGLKVNSGVKKL